MEKYFFAALLIIFLFVLSGVLELLFLMALWHIGNFFKKLNDKKGKVK